MIVQSPETRGNTSQPHPTAAPPTSEGIITKRPTLTQEQNPKTHSNTPHILIRRRTSENTCSVSDGYNRTPIATPKKITPYSYPNTPDEQNIVRGPRTRTPRKTITCPARRALTGKRTTARQLCELSLYATDHTTTPKPQMQHTPMKGRSRHTHNRRTRSPARACIMKPPPAPHKVKQAGVIHSTQKKMGS